ncbi:anti-phage defense-associated sirtuin Dsr1 [Sulfuricaulis sp.]|jgi:hypothetical protein|uniref:anti-phage defense-associated sirtuin Dsr1 n=1 Tax=Sulfuricaulis sp. TaxID=2003553 RepID=UPI00355ACDAB
MPAFVSNGPNIPEHLLQAHEDGRVVFFCGAGISTPAGLPLFKGLVDDIYAQLGTTKTPVEDKAYEKEQYDATLDQLERRYPGQRLAVRSTLATILKPKWHRKDATTTHGALLQLATDRKGAVRIVTTNFDRIFQRVIAKQKLDTPSLAAPLLPIPKPSRWHGVVHLHGLLPDRSDDTALNRLVLSSGDFGLAYLTERWAARFVSELFRYHIVCFVGYGINDPVLRYMMDALAADELLGEAKPDAYAFASFCDGEEKETLTEWEAKGVIPLLYKVPTGTQDHSALHRTLKEWADTYRDGVRGKEMIIAQHASTPPLAPSRSDYAVGRVLWALTDGLAAKHFADLNPVPPIKWLEPLCEDQFEHRDLSRFGVAANSNENKKLSFSIVRRPAPYTHSPWMCIVDMGGRGSDWDVVMFQLARWLTRHLDDPGLIIWLAKKGGQLHERFARLIRSRLEELDRLDAEGKQDDLDRIRADAPRAIPGPLMRTLWRILLAGRLRPLSRRFDLYDWLRRIKQDGITPSLRMELREILTPYVTLRAPFHWDEEKPDPFEPRRIKDLVDWELELASDYVHSALRDREDKSKWQAALPDLLQDFTGLLRDALDLMKELGGVEDKSDSTYIHQPSISEHPQNRDFHDWTALIELTRDAWLATAQSDRVPARHAAEGWWQAPYPVFKRLALFAATHEGVISRRQALDWVLADECWWLWSVETEREALRLLVALAPKLSEPEMAELEQAILRGPPRAMFKKDIEQEEWERIVNREMWLRLAKVQATGAELGQVAKTKLDELTLQHPRWQLAEDERDEFPYWMGEGEGDEWREFYRTPHRRRELVLWLKEHASSDPWKDDDWRQRCRDDFPTTACALCALANEGVWLGDRWREALQAWSEEKLIKRSWRYMSPVLINAPDELVRSHTHGISWWLKAIAKTFEGHEALFFLLCRRILAMNHEDGVEGEDPVMQAINHPVGHVTEALLQWWYRRSLEDGQSLPEELKPIFTELCNIQIEKFRHGRVLLAAHVIALYRVDRDWTTEHLLPMFDWQRSPIEARAVWEGFLWSPRLYRPLLSAIKQPLLETAARYGELGKHADQYAAFLTFAALDPGDTFTPKELADAIRRLPADGLKSSAQALVRALEGARDQRGEYWRNRLLPYLRSIWPKTRELITPAISENLARLCVAAGAAFPEALQELRYWLQPAQNPDFLVHLMHEAKLCEKFPEDALAFLTVVVADDAQWLPRELRQCLDAIEHADQQLANDVRFIRLAELIRRGGMV